MTSAFRPIAFACMIALFGGPARAADAEAKRDWHSHANAEHVCVRHLDLDLEIMFDQRFIQGEVLLRIERTSGALKQPLVLDTRGLAIKSAEVSGTAFQATTFEFGREAVGTVDKILGWKESPWDGLPSPSNRARSRSGLALHECAVLCEIDTDLGSMTMVRCTYECVDSWRSRCPQRFGELPSATCRSPVAIARQRGRFQRRPALAWRTDRRRSILPSGLACRENDRRKASIHPSGDGSARLIAVRAGPGADVDGSYLGPSRRKPLGDDSLDARQG